VLSEDHERSRANRKDANFLASVSVTQRPDSLEAVRLICPCSV